MFVSGKPFQPITVLHSSLFGLYLSSEGNENDATTKKARAFLSGKYFLSGGGERHGDVNAVEPCQCRALSAGILGEVPDPHCQEECGIDTWGLYYKTFTTVFMYFRNKLGCLSLASLSGLV